MTNLRQNKGFALVFSLIFIFLIINFIAIYILSIANGSLVANRTVNGIQAYYVADAGLVDAYERITQAGINTVPTTPSGKFYINNASYPIGTAIGNYSVAINNSNQSPVTYTITSTGTYNGVSITLQLKMTGASISKYAYWSNSEKNPEYGQLNWWKTTTTGPVQTNGTLYIAGDPIFIGPVSQSGPSIHYDNPVTDKNDPNLSNPNIIFPDGLTVNAPAVDIPPQATLGAIFQTANSLSGGVPQGLVLTGPSTIIFNPDGTLNVTGTVKDSQGNVTTAYNNSTIAAPANKVIYVQSNCKITNNCPPFSSPAGVPGPPPSSGLPYGPQDGDVKVQGTVNGQLTVAADDNIYLSGSIAYNQDPRTPGNANSTDMLGLVSENDITVITASVPKDLEISAVLVSLQGSFRPDAYISGPEPSHKMDIFGSMINFYGAPIQSVWNRTQSYDTRLATMAPPGFPPYVNNLQHGVYSKISIQEL